MDAAAFDALRGAYQHAPHRVVFVGRYDTANAFFLADGDLRPQVFPVGPRECLAEDLRTIRFEPDEGAATDAVFAEDGRPPRRAPRVRPYEQELVTFSSGDVRLEGVLTVPRGAGPHPALVLVNGSGPGTRWHYAVEIDRFARGGLATLAFDKRGVGGSTGDWRRADFDDLAEDVLAGVRFLRRDRRVHADRVGLWGISQAGWVLPLAAARSAEVAFIIPVSGAAVTPAEQELWRHRQNLEFLGVPGRFVEFERRAAAMGYDWQRRHQLGQMPIPNFFADDNLNIFHDAPAVLRRVRQPVLAVFGGRDTLTPPYESAALWARALRQRGGDDFSVRVFPRGNHGLQTGGATGSPLELDPEVRWVPGYFDTTLRWIRHHTGGPPFSQARQVDVDPDADPVESRGMDRVGVYGGGAVQPFQLVLSLVVFACAAVATPAGWLWRRARGAPDARPAGARRATRLAALLGLTGAGVLLAMTWVAYLLVQASPHPLFAWLGVVWNAMAVATWLSLALVAGVAWNCLRAWRQGWWLLASRLAYTLVALAGLCWVSFVFYWDLVRPAW
jgi:dienelactone hydrolase